MFVSIFKEYDKVVAQSVQRTPKNLADIFEHFRYAEKLDQKNL